jgi:WD40 repeat protein
MVRCDTFLDVMAAVLALLRYDICIVSSLFQSGTNSRLHLQVHPLRSCFAVCEKGTTPHVYIYQSSSLELLQSLPEGTERAYNAASFSGDGQTLATVGGYPDYMLTVWNWTEGTIILRAKAFAQEVFRVTFSPILEGQLITSGTGHIRFWRMARTFTGLKLQGLIGKFGQVELTDIAAYVELPSGIVLSGTEGGNLLLWDGNVIKCEVSRKGGRPCHRGAIEVLYFDSSTGLLLSAGDDGYIRTWDYTAMESAEPSDDMPIVEMEPMSEVPLDLLP